MEKVLLLLVIAQLFIIWTLYENRQRKKTTISALRNANQLLDQRLRDRSDKLRQLTTTLTQASHRHQQTTALLNETTDYLNSILHSMPSAMIGVTPSGYVTHWNAATEQLTGLSEREALGYRLAEVFPQLPVPAETIDQAIASSRPQTLQAVKYLHAGDTIYLDITVYPLLSSELTGAVIRMDDVTPRIKLENMMIQNEKMLSLGEMAAGVAHEINNPLAAILQSLQNVQRRISPDLPANQRAAQESGIELPNLQRYLEHRGIPHFFQGMQDAGERATAIVHGMLEFVRGSSLPQQPTDVNDVVRRSVAFGRHTLSLSMPGLLDQLDLQMQLSTPLPLVLASGQELQQVILNLVKNAAQAQRDAGTDAPVIRIETAHEGDEVLITVADNGPGIPSAVQKYIFDPFFTTKEVGQGTGLGLSISYFIITERHNGRIEVISAPNQGSRFIIHLPVLGGTDATIAAANAPAASTAPDADATPADNAPSGHKNAASD